MSAQSLVSVLERSTEGFTFSRGRPACRRALRRLGCFLREAAQSVAQARAGSDAELGEHLVEVGSDGAVGDLEPLPDLLVPSSWCWSVGSGECVRASGWFGSFNGPMAATLGADGVLAVAPPSLHGSGLNSRRSAPPAPASRGPSACARVTARRRRALGAPGERVLVPRGHRTPFLKVAKCPSRSRLHMSNTTVGRWPAWVSLRTVDLAGPDHGHPEATLPRRR